MKARIVETDLSRAGAQGALVVLRAHRRGPRLRHPLPAAGGSGGRDPSGAAPTVGRSRDTTRRAHTPRRPDGGAVARRAGRCSTRTCWPGADGYLDVANLAVSPGHTRLAYATDTTGDERFTLRVRDLEPAATTSRTASRGRRTAWPGPTTTPPSSTPGPTPPTGRTSCGATAWAATVRGDVLVLEEPDERFHLGVGRTKDGAYVVVELHSRITSEVQVIAADRARGDARAWWSPARRGSSTASSTTAGRSSCSPTTTPRTSGSWPRPADDARRAVIGSELIAHRPDGAARGARRLRRPRRQLRAARRHAPDQGDPAAPDGPGGTASCPRDTWCRAPRPRRRRGVGPTPSSPADIAALRVLVAGHAPLGLRPRPRRAARPCCASASPFSAATTRRATPPSAGGPTRARRDPRCPCRSSAPHRHARDGDGAVPALRLRLLRVLASTRSSRRCA